MADPTGDRLFQAILDEPADDALRLILADWLTDHGDEDRAEFIRVQCELARLEGRRVEPLVPTATTLAVILDATLEYQRECLRVRSRELLEANRVAWLADAPCPMDAWSLDEPMIDWAYGMRCRFRRGFVAELTCRADAWLGTPCPVCGGDGFYTPMGPDTFTRTCNACQGTGHTDAHGPAVLARQPIERVTLTSLPGGEAVLTFTHQGGYWCVVGQRSQRRGKTCDFWKTRELMVKEHVRKVRAALEAQEAQEAPS